jgi:hypothetical protein
MTLVVTLIIKKDEHFWELYHFTTLDSTLVLSCINCGILHVQPVFFPSLLLLPSLQLRRAVEHKWKLVEESFLQKETRWFFVLFYTLFLLPTKEVMPGVMVNLDCQLDWVEKILGY